ncbi:hypothetical protein P3T35_003464 [Kitasatospora sp. GP30]|nr:hypothetical protein [Kitasatospora sp. GP30]
MWWQALLVALAAAGFPTLVLLFFIGGPNYRDKRGRDKAKAGARGN